MLDFWLVYRAPRNYSRLVILMVASRAFHSHMTPKNQVERVKGYENIYSYPKRHSHTKLSILRGHHCLHGTHIMSVLFTRSIRVNSIHHLRIETREL